MLALAAASLVVAGAVSVSGLIGFVGLMMPHMVRLVVGPRHRLLLPASVLAGAIALVLADLVARIVLAPVEIPVGIVTALEGQPLDKGDFDNRAVLTTLKEIGYKGPVGVMCYGISGDTREYLQRSMKKWKEWNWQSY